MNNSFEITREYYATWLGTKPELLNQNGVFWVYNPSLNNKPIGYSKTIDLYLFITSSTMIVSYGDKISGDISKLKEKLENKMSVEIICEKLKDIYNTEPSHNVKYIFKNEEISRLPKEGKRLTANDYDLYLQFFKNVNPNCKDTTWVEDYFYEISEKGYSHGVIINDKLVSATDAPDMPFMSKQVQEIGINTIPIFQGKGYAKSACLSCIHEMIDVGICPQWSTDISNIASQKLALSVGFENYFDNVSLSL